MNITYDEFMDMHFEYFSQRYKKFLKIERLNGVNNRESTQFRIYCRNFTEIITMTPDRKPHDTEFRLVKVQG